jgi:hypothetical protein
MAQWGMKDASSNAVTWAVAKLHKTPNTAQTVTLYTNTTANGYFNGRTDGIFSIDTNRIHVGRHVLSAVSANGPGTGGSYVPGEVLSITNTGATAVKAATVKVLTTKVRTVTANAATGTGYANGDTVTANGGVMTTNAVFTVTTGTSNTSVAALALTTNGVFTANPNLTDSVLTTLTGTGSGAKATLTMRVNTLGVVDVGSYSVVPTEANNNALSGSASGTGATAAFTWGNATGQVAHTGWILRTVGSGGRAGREFAEVLVAGGITSENASANTIYPSA